MKTPTIELDGGFLLIKTAKQQNTKNKPLYIYIFKKSVKKYFLLQKLRKCCFAVFLYVKY